MHREPLTGKGCSLGILGTMQACSSIFPATEEAKVVYFHKPLPKDNQRKSERSGFLHSLKCTNNFHSPVYSSVSAEFETLCYSSKYAFL